LQKKPRALIVVKRPPQHRGESATVRLASLETSSVAFIP